MDMVVALGGDGTVNEVVNGLLTDGPRPGIPALAVVPGGSTNVFVRAIGLPPHPFDATGVILEALRAGRTRRIGLGLAGDRYFTFNAGFGFDADVVRRIERRRRAGEETSHARFVRAALAQFFTSSRRHPGVTYERPGHDPVDGIHFALVTNTAPWTYLGDRPVQPSPEASFETGLDLFAPRSMRTVTTLRYLRRALLSKPPRTRCGGFHSPRRAADQPPGGRRLDRRARLGALPVGPGRAARRGLNPYSDDLHRLLAKKYA
jgi:diacylglycerol kinase family enzyme